MSKIKIKEMFTPSALVFTIILIGAVTLIGYSFIKRNVTRASSLVGNAAGALAVGNDFADIAAKKVEALFDGELAAVHPLGETQIFRFVVESGGHSYRVDINEDGSPYHIEMID